MDPDRWKETMQDYYSAVQDVGLKLLRIIAEGLGLEPDFFARRYTNIMGNSLHARGTSLKHKLSYLGSFNLG